MSPNRQNEADGKKPFLSFVIPAMNEEETLCELFDGIRNNVPSDSFEVIFIDDGSTDETWMVMQALADVHKDQVIGLRFRSNRGKASALAIGLEAARGDIIFTMDADLQDDPKEIPNFLAKLDEGYDLVSGWKQVRHDPWHKVLPSRVFNRMLSWFSGVALHDHNCGFKAYRAELAKSLSLYGELHRMVPSLAGIQGFRVAEIPVQHHPRQHGVSKYGVERFIRGFSDMLTIGFLRRFRQRPSHFTNAVAIVYGMVATTLLAAGLFSLSTTAGVFTALAGVLVAGMSFACVISGLICELVIRSGRESEANPVAEVARNTSGLDSADRESQASTVKQWSSRVRAVETTRELEAMEL